MMSDRSMFGPEWTVSPTGNGNEHHLFDGRGKVAATGYKGEKLQYVADCVNRIATLEAERDDYRKQLVGLAEMASVLNSDPCEPISRHIGVTHIKNVASRILAEHQAGG